MLMHSGLLCIALRLSGCLCKLPEKSHPATVKGNVQGQGSGSKVTWVKVKGQLGSSPA